VNASLGGCFLLLVKIFLLLNLKFVGTFSLISLAFLRKLPNIFIVNFKFHMVSVLFFVHQEEGERLVIPGSDGEPGIDKSSLSVSVVL